MKFSALLTLFVFKTKVQAVPTVLAVKGGQVVDKFVGMKDDDSLQSFINALQS